MTSIETFTIRTREMTSAIVVARKTTSCATGSAVTHVQSAIDKMAMERMTRMMSSPFFDLRTSAIELLSIWRAYSKLKNTASMEHHRCVNQGFPSIVEYISDVLADTTVVVTDVAEKADFTLWTLCLADLSTMAYQIVVQGADAVSGNNPLQQFMCSLA